MDDGSDDFEHIRRGNYSSDEDGSGDRDRSSEQVTTASAVERNFASDKNGKGHADRTETPTALESQDRKGKRRHDEVPKSKSHILRAYRDLLNLSIAEALDPDSGTDPDSLPSSQIGVSIWTSQEKHRFFSALPSCGPGNLPALSAAISTKSEPEVKAYILLLQAGVRELDAPGTRVEKFDLSDVPAAAEIGETPLNAEELLAEALEKRARDAEEDLEKTKWGDERWLIDDDQAAEIEAKYDTVDTAGTGAGDEDEEEVKTGPNHYDDFASQHGLDDDSNDENPLNSDHLLKPAAFLQLSRSLYMNSSNLEQNWHNVIEGDPSVSGPSIRRTAFDDLYNLTVSLTRRLVQVAIFQGLSRLRASSDSRHIPHVTRNDVEASRDIIGLKVNKPAYWAAAVRRCRVEVYGDTTRLRAVDGRHGTKRGFKLTQKELELELGVKSPDAAPRPDDSIENNDDTYSDDLDSDAYTIASSSESSDDEDSEPQNDKATTRKRRKRPLSPISFDRAERRYLESLDRVNSKAEENKLRFVMGLDPLPGKPRSKPEFLFKRAAFEQRPPDWREVVQYEAPWEQPCGLPEQAEFEKTDVEGIRRRKRRRIDSETHEESRDDEEELNEDDANGGVSRQSETLVHDSDEDPGAVSQDENEDESDES